MPSIPETAGQHFGLILLALVLFALLLGMVCGFSVACYFCRSGPAGGTDDVDVGPNQWVPSIPTYMFKTGSGERIHLYGSCNGQQKLYRWNQEKLQVCAHCLAAWRKAIDAEMTIYLQNHSGTAPKLPRRSRVRVNVGSLNVDSPKSRSSKND